MTATDIYYDPYDLDISANPWPTYARLREEEPLPVALRAGRRVATHLTLAEAAE